MLLYAGTSLAKIQVESKIFSKICTDFPTLSKLQHRYLGYYRDHCQGMYLKIIIYPRCKRKISTY